MSEAVKREVKKSEIIASAWGVGATANEIVYFNGGSMSEYETDSMVIPVIKLHPTTHKRVVAELKRVAMNRLAAAGWPTVERYIPALGGRV